ncbi:MAG: LysM peptidoglycan-binding domain-containing protein [Methanobacterium sp.]
MKRYLLLFTAVVFFFVSPGISNAAQNVYVVKQGDSLWTIASKYGMTVEKLRQINHLSSDSLQIGDKLVVSAASSSQTSSTVVKQGQTYTVQSGDSLWTIARKFNTNVNQLKKLNNLSSDALKIGDKLYVSGNPQPTPSRSKTTVTVPLAPVAVPTAANTAASAAAGTTADAICNMGAQYLGTPYHYGGYSPAGFDCSGFVSYLFKQAGYSLPHTAAGIFNYGSPIDKSNLRKGDLVFFKGPGASQINHVGIYVSDGNFIHSSSGRGCVTYSALSSSYYSSYYAGAKRILPE